MPEFFESALDRIREVVDPLLDGRVRRSAPAVSPEVVPGAPQQLEWMDQTTLHPLAVVLFLTAGLVILGGRRTHAILAYLLFMACVSGAQNFNLGGTSLYLLRLLILCGLLRCILHHEWRTVRWNAIDAFVAAWIVVGTAIYLVQQGNAGALVTKAGLIIDGAGGYFVFRCLLKEKADIVQAIRSFAVIALPVSLVFLFERMTQYNLFSMFGGVPEITVVREGKLRCQGPFPHPILAGVFWAANFPLLVGLGVSNRSMILSVLGCGACLLTIAACSSSTPVLGVATALMGMSFFLVRKQMRVFQIGGVLLLCGLHLVMKAPVWHLLARADVLGGSTGHYRFMLVDATIRYFSEWCLVGLASNEHWGRAYGHYLTDITNQYVLEGLRGGALTLLLFVVAIWSAFVAVGRLVRSKLTVSDQWLVWSLGVCLAVHCVSFLAVSYFGQIVLLYFVHLAMVASLPGVMAVGAPGRILTQSMDVPEWLPPRAALIHQFHAIDNPRV